MAVAMAMGKDLDEHSEQVLVINWVRANQDAYPELALLFAIPNGGARDKATGYKLKAEGVLPGVPDIFLPAARKGFHGLFIELKNCTGKLSKEQVKYIAKVREQGYLCEVCQGHKTAIAVLEKYLEESIKKNVKNS